MHTKVSDEQRSPAQVSTSGNSLRKMLIRALLGIASSAVLAWMITGIVLRITGYRDRFDHLAIVYYTTPWLVIAVGFGALGFLSRWRQHKKRAILYAVFSIGAGIAWLWTSWCFGTRLDASPEFRVVLWNVRNNEEDLDQFAARIREFSPDIVALAEAGNHNSNIKQWRAAFPDYTVEQLPKQMLTMSKTGLKPGNKGALAYGSFYGIHTTQLGRREVTLIQPDIDARPFESRGAAIQTLTTFVRNLAGKPVIVLGDFNTPRQSIHLDPLRGLMKHAFETRGFGLADTWPIPLPVLSLDQVWVSPEFEVVSCRQGWTINSDHRPVFVELRFK